MNHIIAITTLALLSLCSSLQGQSRPNIVIFLADDLGYGDVGFTGCQDIKTPRIDKLAANGVIFNNAHVTHPYCGPSRAGLLTGRYQSRFGMGINVSYSPFDPHMGLPVDEQTFGTRLQKSGYKTAIIGKWHLGAAPPHHPNHRGFDHFYGFLSGGHTFMPEKVNNRAPLVTSKGTSRYSETEGYFLPLVRNNREGEFDEYLTTAISRDAGNFVRETEGPFCLYVAYNAPHSPLEAPEEVIAKYRHIKNPRRRIYAAMIDVMDQGIGMVVDALKETGAFENTLIFFLSDNGGVVLGKGWKKTADYANHGPLRGGKGTLYDGGSRVPFFAHWPAKLPKGKVYDGLTSSLDIAATAIAIGHGDLSGKKLDGVNLMPYLTKSKKGSPHEAVYWREGDGSGWAVRTQEYKYLKLNGSTDSPEMYALQEDPSESENIVGDLPEKQAELASKWNEWNKLNVSTLLLSSGSYQKARLKFYEEMFLRRKEASAKKKLLMIK